MILVWINLNDFLRLNDCCAAQRGGSQYQVDHCWWKDICSRAASAKTGLVSSSEEGEGQKESQGRKLSVSRHVSDFVLNKATEEETSDLTELSASSDTEDEESKKARVAQRATKRKAEEIVDIQVCVTSKRSKYFEPSSG